MPGGSPAYSGGNPMPNSFNIVGTFKHAIDLVKNPVGVMMAYRDSDLPVNSVMIYYVAVLAAVPFIATLIGDLWYYGIFGYLGILGFGGYGYAVVSAILTYIGDVVGVFILGYLISMLAPSFGANTTLPRAIKLAAYVFTPVFLLSVLYIIPFVGFLVIFGVLYGLYILYLGLPVLTNAPKDRVLTFTIVIVVVAVVIYAVIGAIVGTIAGLIFLHSIGFF